jgi:hypothetical protein
VKVDGDSGGDIRGDSGDSDTAATVEWEQW